MAVERTVELLMHKTIYPEIFMQLQFIKENCHRLISALTSLETKEIPLACTVYNLLEDLRFYLRAGATKTTFGTETDQCLSKLSDAEKKKTIKSFQDIFKQARTKLEHHLEQHPAYSFYRAVRIFDPREDGTLSGHR